MGINATVVYDIQNHTTLVVRTPVSTPTHRHDVLDTIASFSQHCESLRGVATSITEVCALWGGPPYISYNVAANRFRVIVVWDDASARIDVPHDVYHAVVRLQRAVSAVAEPLVRRDTGALASIYDEAAHALRPTEPVAMPPPVAEKSSARGRLLPLQALSGRRTSVVGARSKKKPPASSSANPGLFGRLGAAIRNSVAVSSSAGAGTGNEGRDILEDSATITDGGSSKAPDAQSDGTHPEFGPEGRLDDAQGALQLPDDVFDWSPFAVPLTATPSPTTPNNHRKQQQQEDALQWFSGLVRGQAVPPVPLPPTSPLPSPKQPALRVTSEFASAPPTPLTVRSVVVVDPVESIVTRAGTNVLSPRQNGSSPANAPTVDGAARTPSPAPLPASTGVSAPLSPVVTPLSPKVAPSAAVADEAGVAATPSAQTGHVNETVTGPKSPPKNDQMSADVISSGAPSSRPTMSMGSTMPQPSQTTPVTGAVVPTAMTMEQLQQQQRMMQQQQPANVLVQQQLHQQKILQQQQALYQRQALQQQQQQPLQQQPPVVEPLKLNQQQADTSTSQETVSNIPAALRESNTGFDMSRLGDYKDVATETVQLNDGPVTYDIKKSEDEVIRVRMNEFAVSMQAGNFPQALQQVYGTLRYLCHIKPQREREIVTCSNYVLAQKILMRNATLEGELLRVMAGSPDAVRRHVESALLTMFLAELKHLLPRHRVAAMRVAVEKNFAVGNFGMSVRWLRQLVEKAPPAQRDVLTKQMQVCVANGERNDHMPPTNRLCYATLQVVMVPYGKCDLCTAVYHATHSGVVDGQACDTCFVGTIYSQRT